MFRAFFLALLVSLILLGGVARAPSPSLATLSLLDATPLPECSDSWQELDVRPYGEFEAVVEPAVSAEPSEHVLYLVMITLPPGGCVGYEAHGNQKEGPIVLMIQQGKIEYQWRPYVPPTGTATPEPERPAPTVIRGDMAQVGNRVFHDGEPVFDNGIVPEQTPQILYPGDWLTQDQRFDFTYRNVGSDSAIILKAVYAVRDPGGCRGGCK